MSGGHSQLISKLSDSVVRTLVRNATTPGTGSNQDAAIDEREWKGILTAIDQDGYRTADERRSIDLLIQVPVNRGLFSPSIESQIATLRALPPNKRHPVLRRDMSFQVRLTMMDASLFRVDPRFYTIRLSHTDQSGIDYTKPMVFFATESVQLVFPSGPHDGVRLKSNEQGQRLRPSQTEAYWDPVGIRIDQGHWNGRDRPNDKYAHGIFYVEQESKKTGIVPIEEFTDFRTNPKKYQVAIQAGPILVRNGKAVPNLDRDYPMGRIPRAVVGIMKNGDILFVRVASEVSLQDCAQFLATHLEAVDVLALQGDSGALFFHKGELSEFPSRYKDRTPPRFYEVVIVE